MGWHYVLFSTAARKMSGIECPKANVTRVRLRRVGGLFMAAAAAALFELASRLQSNLPDASCAYLLLGVLLLLFFTSLLALIDLRLTLSLKRQY